MTPRALLRFPAPQRRNSTTSTAFPDATLARPAPSGLGNPCNARAGPAGPCAGRDETDFARYNVAYYLVVYWRGQDEALVRRNTRVYQANHATRARSQPTRLAGGPPC